MRRALKFKLLIAFLLAVNILIGQVNPNGSPQITNYASDDYQAEDQNWCIFQDKRGVMYFGNSSGVLVFDGVNWDLIPLPGQNIAWRIVANTSDEIFVGGSGEIGVLRSNPNGLLKYHSLLNKIPEKYRNFRDIWGLYWYDSSLVFISFNRINILKNDSTKVIETPNKISEVGLFNDTLYLEVEKMGLHYLKNNQLIRLAEIDNEPSFRRLIPWNANTGLLSGRDGKLYFFKNKKTIRWKTELDTYFSNLAIYHIIPIGKQFYAIATVKNGIVIIDKKGKIIRHINNKNGLASNTIYYLFLDSQNRLWAGHNHGISCIEIFSPFTHFSSQNNITSTVSTAAIYNNKLFLGGEPSLYSIEWPLNNNLQIPQFTNLNLYTGQIYSLKVFDNKLFCNHQQGVTIIEPNNNHYTIKLPDPCTWLTTYGKGQKLIFVSSGSALYLLNERNNKWYLKHQIKGHQSYAKGLGFDYNDHLWTFVNNEGVARLKLNKELDSIIGRKIFHQINGHKLDLNSDLYIVDQQVFVLIAGRIYAYNSFKNDFTEINFEFDGKILNIIEWKEQECVWLNTTEGILKFEKDSGAFYHPNNEAYLNFRHFSKTRNIYTIKNSDFIFMHPKGASYYHKNDYHNINFKLNTRICRVKLIKNDSVLFGGTFPFNSSVFSNIQPKNHLSEIEYTNNSIRFNFGTSVPQVNKKISYQYKLKGFDTKWSSWTKETTKDYTNLGAGTYTFMVKAQSPTQETGEIATYKFNILSPWYLTNKAFLLYFILLLINTLIIYWIIRNRVRKKFKKVEKDIKIDLFTNISHEIKTPITLILSPLEEIIAKAKETDENNSLHLLMYRNAKKLKHLVNLLLDLRKVETGSMHLQVKKDDIIQFVEDIFIPFNYIASQNRIDYRFNTVFDSREMYFDPQKLEIILTNILSNAFKYTNKEGKISVTLCENTNNLNAFILKDFKESPPNLKIGKFIGKSSIKIVIEDTGAGISEEEISKIFKRFYHDTKKNHLNSKNTGIGLAFTEKLIQLHRCELLVWSKPGYGSRFLIHLSTDEDYYNQEEIDKNSVLPLKNKPIVTLKKDSQTPDTEDIIVHKPSILIVDDEQDMRVYLKKLFENDYIVLEAKDGKHGLVLAQQELPDIIISDIKMPEMDGIEFCRKIKSDAFTAHIPILMLTASTNENIQFESFESGANQYLSKPFNPSLLRVRVKKLLENSKKIKEQIGSNYINDVTNLVKDIPEKDNLLNKAIEIINEKLSDPEFNINALAAELNLSRTILYRKFKKYTEITPNEFIQVIRLKKSKSLLCRNELTISEVAYLVGYNDAKYFSTSFKKQFNLTPKEYRIGNQENLKIV